MPLDRPGPGPRSFFLWGAPFRISGMGSAGVVPVPKRRRRGARHDKPSKEAMMATNRPDVLVSAFITGPDGRVLLTRHAPYFKWHLPDGDVVRGERLADALVRAVRHDLGIEVVPDTAPFLVTETITKAGV